MAVMDTIVSKVNSQRRELKNQIKLLPRAFCMYMHVHVLLYSTVLYRDRTRYGLVLGACIHCTCMIGSGELCPFLEHTGNMLLALLVLWVNYAHFNVKNNVGLCYYSCFLMLLCSVQNGL